MRTTPDTETYPHNRPVDLVDPVHYHTLLNSVATTVSEKEMRTPRIQRLIDGMIRLAEGKGANGTRQMVGLAAPQVGIGKQIVLIDMTLTGTKQVQRLEAFINPRITKQSHTLVDGREGCWSCGEICGNVSRAEKITLDAYDRSGAPVSFDVSGFVARIAQHEIDHLNGIRFPDRIPHDEPWRLLYVPTSDFESFRQKWEQWPLFLDRSDWLALKNGQSNEPTHPIVRRANVHDIQQYAAATKLDPLYAQKISSGVTSGTFLFFIATCNDTYVGQVGLCIGSADEQAFREQYAQYAVIYQLFVTEHARGKGVASRLMDVAESFAKKVGKIGVVLGVVSDNTPARTLYERRGYHYAHIDTHDTITSYWDVTDPNGQPTRVAVDVLPMEKSF